jgi:hypothetical protein
MVNFIFGAEKGTRTPTRFLPQPPQGCVSASSTIPAIIKLYNTRLKKQILVLNLYLLKFIIYLRLKNVSIVYLFNL